MRVESFAPSDSYHDFLTEFLYLAGEASIPPIQFKEELYEKLTYRLKEVMMFHRESSCTFEEFSIHCSHAANTIQSIAVAEAKARTATRTQIDTGSRRKETSPAPRVQSSGLETRPTVPLSKEKLDMMKMGL